MTLTGGDCCGDDIMKNSNYGLVFNLKIIKTF